MQRPTDRQYILRESKLEDSIKSLPSELSESLTNDSGKVYIKAKNPNHFLTSSNQMINLFNSYFQKIFLLDLLHSVLRMASIYSLDSALRHSGTEVVYSLQTVFIAA